MEVNFENDFLGFLSTFLFVFSMNFSIFYFIRYFQFYLYFQLPQFLLVSLNSGDRQKIKSAKEQIKFIDFYLPMRSQMDLILEENGLKKQIQNYQLPNLVLIYLMFPKLLEGALN